MKGEILVFIGRKKNTDEVVISSCLKAFSEMLSNGKFNTEDIDDFKKLIESDIKTVNRLAEKVWGLKKSDPSEAGKLESSVIRLNDEIQIAEHYYRILIEKTKNPPSH